MTDVVIHDPGDGDPVVLVDAGRAPVVVYAQPTGAVTVAPAASAVPIVQPDAPQPVVLPMGTEPAQVLVAPAPVPDVTLLGIPGLPGPPGPRGPEGPPGPQGEPGIDADLAQLAYTHTQGTASSVWLIEHPLTYRPNVSVVDSAGTEVEGEVEYLGPQTIRLTFSGAFSGVAHLS